MLDFVAEEFLHCCEGKPARDHPLPWVISKADACQEEKTVVQWKSLKKRTPLLGSPARLPK